MTYQETIEFLFSQLPMFSRVGAPAYKADLKNTMALCDALGNPQQKLKFVHIAGTNGKGSVSHSMAAILQKAGYKTGLYTSPHLYDFRERIRVNGEMVEKSFVVDFTEKIQSAINEIQPSFFELTVAMALDYFLQQQVDIVVMEVGLGGRLDSTNIILPEVSVITNIGFDHQAFLGDTLIAIAGEKAGIIKEHVPVIIGEMHPETQAVFYEKAIAHHTTIVFADQDYQILATQQTPEYLKVAVQHNEVVSYYQLDLNGWYQQKNLLTILATVAALTEKGWKISAQAVEAALQSVKTVTGLLGRWDVLQQHPLVVADVAHNVDGIQQLLEQLVHLRYEKLFIIIGMVKDKEVEKVLSLLPKEAHYYFTQSHIQRALPANILAEKANNVQLAGEEAPDVNGAIQLATAAAKENDLILICGSVFLIAEIDRSIF
ncbi:bifunctional folylpolyglutamate synthase/dihydrofolate synthase [Gynurincola endophyticus]|uniref:bifunctional folylpolyglutamate synthase/dihydrofolate synthase n=1 Tax=Gynurincola endophyticus TaxID=2479004 RepID=UPI000F8E4B02|nr:folylpolyglutamate synthase/dihydrofolate synthase family protein [Gynurincola endophyticus]